MTNIHTYHTWHEFVRASESPDRLNDQPCSSREQGRDSWHGTGTFQEAADLANRGWPDGLRRIKNTITIIERFMAQRQPRRELEYDIRGPGIIDFDRYIQGRPDSWVVWEDVDDQAGVSTQIVPIIYNVATSSGVSIDTMFYRGAAVVALIDILEHNNIRCDVTLTSRVNHRHEDYLFRVHIKKAGDVLDLDRMAYALCHGAVLRRLMFSLFEEHITNLESSYGQPTTWHEDGAINLDGASLYINEEEDMVPWLIKQLSNYGIEVE